MGPMTSRESGGGGTVVDRLRRCRPRVARRHAARPSQADSDWVQGLTILACRLVFEPLRAGAGEDTGKGTGGRGAAAAGAAGFRVARGRHRGAHSLDEAGKHAGRVLAVESEGR